jgi:hypothetical protein
MSRKSLLRKNQINSKGISPIKPKNFRLYEGLQNEFARYRTEINNERERDIVTTSEAMLSTQLAEMTKNISRLASENDGLKNQAIIYQLSETNWKDKYMDQGFTMAEKDQWFSEKLEHLERENIATDRLLIERENEVKPKV